MPRFARRPSLLLPFYLLLTVPALCAAQAAAAPDTPDPALEHQRQQQRDGALRRQLEQSADIRRPQAPVVDFGRLPAAETPCFEIRQVELGGPDAGRFPWLVAALAGPRQDDPPQGRCLGTDGIKLLLKRLQNELLVRGFITSRVAVPSQDLNSGTLMITVQAGRYAGARFADDSGARTTLGNAIPARPGAVLNLRDLEQALENLKRLPSADADIEIHPSEQPGASDLVVGYTRASPLRVTLAADDGGLKASGKHQGSLTLAYDNPLGINDLLYLSLAHDLEARGARRGSWGGLFHYSVPYGYWSTALTVSRNRDRQTVVGATTDYVYSGYSNLAELTLSRIVHRDGHGKTALSAGAWRRTSHNFIDDTEVEVQHRQTGGWQAGANHRRFIGLATLDATLQYRHGTGAFGAIAAPEELFGEGTGRFRKSTGDLRLDLPFRLAGRTLGYNALLRGQWNHSQLNPQEMFVIGGRYTVRGFDGENLLAGERGWLLRNEFTTALGDLGAAGYLGLDYGRVSGPSSAQGIGDHLAGVVLGLRGGSSHWVFDLFVGAPLDKPALFRSASVSPGISIAYTL